jgi:hypothetical protein
MKHRIASTRVLALLALAVFLLPGSGVLGATRQVDSKADYVAGQLVIKFRQPLHSPASVGGPRTGVRSVDDLLQRYSSRALTPLFGGIAASRQGLDRVYVLDLDRGVDVLAASQEFAADTAVEYAEPNYIYTLPEESMLSAAPMNDPAFSEQWALDNTGQTGGTPDADIDAPQAWAISTGSDNVLVAVIDTGIDYTHPELDDGRVRTDIDKDFVHNDDDAMDDNKHGTLVASIIAAESNNGIGVAGVMHHAQLLPVKVITARGVGTLAWIAKGISYAASAGADVINMSLGGLICSQALADAVNYAYFERGVVIVAASGNDGGNLSYPAKLALVISVGATDHNDVVADFSNGGAELDLTAPGVDILSAQPGGYGTYSGTSLAAPYVTGVAGLLLSQRPSLTNRQVELILRSAADDLGAPGFDSRYGYGRISAYQALTFDTPPNPPPSQPQPCKLCAAQVAALDTPNRADTLQLLWRVQEQVLGASATGRAYADLFTRHSPELAGLLLSDSALRDQARQTFDRMRPVLMALTGDGPDVTVDGALVEQAAALTQKLKERASPALYDDLEAVWSQMEAKRLVGSRTTEAWRMLQQSIHIYLPLLAH